LGGGGAAALLLHRLRVGGAARDAFPDLPDQILVVGWGLERGCGTRRCPEPEEALANRGEGGGEEMGEEVLGLRSWTRNTISTQRRGTTRGFSQSPGGFQQMFPTAHVSLTA
jgi:hypothetical protein